MRKRSENGRISVHAIAGTEVVLLGLNAAETAAKGLLGFTIYRRRGKTGRKFALGGGKVFEGVRAKADREKVRSDRAPIQSFMWSDYVVDPDTTYTYTVVPRYGTPDALEPEGDGVEVTVKTEAPELRTHAIYFNRGVAGSQRYSQEFGEYRRWFLIEKPKTKEDQTDEKVAARPLIRPEDVPKGKAYKWLSRGLEEGMLRFIEQAKGKGYALRAAVYEFTYRPAIQAFVDALERRVDVKIIHHAKREKLYRLKMMQKGGVETTTTWTDPSQDAKTYPRRYVVVEQFKDDVCRAADDAVGQVGLTSPDGDLLKAFDGMLIERTDTQISHNKFIILLKNGKPVQVWTGSTNFTAGGIFGQSNVGHVVRDPKVAKKYYDYWRKLSTDPKKKSAKADPPDAGICNWTVLQQPDLDLGELPPPKSITPVFSPRLTKDMLHWYARRIKDARNSVFFTAAFSVDTSFLKNLTEVKKGAHPYLRYILLETRKDRMWDKFRQMAKCKQNQIAWGDVLKRRKGEEEEYHQFVETLTGLNSHVEFLHTKYMLVDPLSDDPLVITGSANFSEPSTTKNDENMLIIRGDKRVADIFIGEFMRLFNHFRSRNKENRMSDEQAKRAHYLCPDDSWTKPYYTKNAAKQSERLLFA
jgi:phosphatidylserine/phosphatidylglycerophosphate/cardiolipin synthase-like enzyme